MYINREEYEKYGYSAVPEDEFERYAYKAEVTVRAYTFDRITDADMRPDESADEETKRVAETNQRGVCEIMDILYTQDRVVVGESGAAIKSFSNEGYSESLDTSENSAGVARRKIRDTVRMYYTSAQLYRGMA